MSGQSISWDDVPKEQFIPGVTRQVALGEKVMLGRILFDEGAKVPTHKHESEPGQTIHIPSNVDHSAEAIEETEEIDAFSPIRSDWLDGSNVYQN
jgi:quercetin dioxygenase-like cupin family protein